jgi:hypothetical protein
MVLARWLFGSLMLGTVGRAAEPKEIEQAANWAHSAGGQCEQSEWAGRVHVPVELPCSPWWTSRSNNSVAETACDAQCDP